MSEWILTSERLPEYGETVIVSHHLNNPYVTIARRRSNFWYMPDGDYSENDMSAVTHWQPLPEPPHV